MAHVWLPKSFFGFDRERIKVFLDMTVTDDNVPGPDVVEEDHY